MKKSAEKNIINYFLAQEIKSLKHHIVLFAQTNNFESLHKLRVNIKKIRAFYAFAERSYGKKYQTNKLKAVFQLAGEIRQLQVNSILIRALEELPQQLLMQLNQQENLLYKDFVSNHLSFLNDVNTVATENSLPTELPGTKVLKKIFKQKQKQAMSMVKHPKRKRLHRFRKSIKKLLYIFKALPKTVRQHIGFNNKVLNKLQLRIGLWHDTAAAMFFIKQHNDQGNFNLYLSVLHKKEKRQFKNICLNIDRLIAKSSDK